ncbi:MAG TPA: rRNA maturation RNase YbeY [Thermogutta sp.]|nr:rRNA maturation RNase YbeY [Thermogutta sp.]
MYRIAISKQVKSCKINRNLIRKAVRVVLQQAGIETAEISIAIVDDATIAQLHGQYLGDPTPTDVLSFVLEEGDHHLEGEIVASAETAAAWAKRLAWPCENELLLYIVHGTLHLVGFDDQTPVARRKMRREEKAVLHKLGVIPPVRRRR